MARNSNRQGVRRARLSHGPHRVRGADTVGDIGIACGFAGRNRAQGLPDPLLKRGPAHVQRQLQAKTRRFDKADHRGNELLEFAVVADQIGTGEPVLLIECKFVGIVAQESGADAPVACGHEDRPEAAFANGETDGCPMAASAEIYGCYTEHLRGRRVETPIGMEPRAINCFRHRGSPGERVPPHAAPGAQPWTLLA